MGKVSVEDPGGTGVYSFNENFQSGLEVGVRVFVIDGEGNEVPPSSVRFVLLHHNKH